MNILLGVCGSIAIYKSLELVRLFVKEGYNVKVIMSEGAKKFITPLTFEALSRNEVLSEATESWANRNNHIDIVKWADVFVIAPASANTINALSNGIANSLLLQSALAYNKEIILAPAMNTNMLKNPITEGSLKLLAINGFKIVKPIEKTLACGDFGSGALADVSDIFDEVKRYLNIEPFWENRRVIVSGGGTIERIDDVRYISNFSSGKMAQEIAKALYYRGADVCVVKTKELKLPSSIYTIDVESAKEMREYIEDSIRVAKKGVLIKPTLKSDFDRAKIIQKIPYLFMVSAVGDYCVKYIQKGKLKKELLGESFSLELVKNIDILDSIAKDGIKTIGFKAEFDRVNAYKNAQNMLINKNLDGVCLNILDEIGFGNDVNEIEFITKTNSTKIEKALKSEIAYKILDSAKELDDGI